MAQEALHGVDIERIAIALGAPPPAAYAAAHAYPASAPAFEPAPCRPRQPPAGPMLRLYVHIPFCAYRCSFCSFAVRVGSQRQEMERYVDAVFKELEWAPAGMPLLQLFVGGGTPTQLPPDLLERLLGGIFRRLPSEGSQVHVVEASPDSITPAHLEVMARHGIGRVSMGTQSLDDAQLGDVSRRHSAQQTLDACRLVLDSGLILNLDLMYGLPGQTHESFRRDFNTLAELGVPSITAYDLRLNERTPVSRDLREVELLDLDRLLGWRQCVASTAKEAGFHQTRWHTFKRMDGAAARHQRAPHHHATGLGYQLGLGLSARSHLGDTVYRNVSRLDSYLERIEAAQSPVEEVFPLKESDRRTQYVLSTLGDGKPLQRAHYRSTFGADFDAHFGATAQRLVAGELVLDDGDTLSLSATGKLLHDRVAMQFYPDHALAWLRRRQAPRRAS